MQTRIIIIANIITFFGALLMVCIGLLKKKQHMLIAQCIQCGLMGTGNFMLGGYTGVIANIITIIRNLVSFKWEFNWIFKAVFIVLQVVSSVGFMIYDGGVSSLIAVHQLYSWLPVLAAIVFTVFLDTKSPTVMKVVMIVTQIMWLIYDLCIINYSGAVFDVLTIITSIVGIILIQREKKLSEEAVRKPEN